MYTCNHSNGDLFMCEDNMLFSRVCSHVCMGKLTWYFIGVYIINTVYVYECVKNIKIKEALIKAPEDINPK